MQLQAQLGPATGAADAVDSEDEWGAGRSTADEFIQPDNAEIHREPSRKGMTLMLLWHVYHAGNPLARTYQYSQYCDRYRRWANMCEQVWSCNASG